MNSKNMFENTKEILVDTLFNTIKIKDSDTYEHSYRVMNYAVKFGLYYNFGYDEIAKLKNGAALHDIGKLGISRNILEKPGRLTEEEFEVIKEHPAIGCDILSYTDCFEEELDIIRHHHEWVNGTGYPDGLKGKEISRICRIISICDAFDAMTSKRPYKEEMTIEQAIVELNKNAGIQFDDELTYYFIRFIQHEYLGLTSIDEDRSKSVKMTEKTMRGKGSINFYVGSNKTLEIIA